MNFKITTVICLSLFKQNCCKKIILSINVGNGSDKKESNNGDEYACQDANSC